MTSRPLGLAVFLAALTAAPPLLADASSPEPSEPAPVPSDPRLLFHPAGPGRGRLALGLGLLVDQPLYASQGFLPIEPQIELRMRVGLPAGFSLAADLSAIFIENNLSAGIAWSTPLPELPRVSVMLQFSAGIQFGGLTGFGFDTFVISPVMRPSVTLGWPMGDSIRWSLREELLLSRWQEVLSGGSWASNGQGDAFGGSVSTITVENLLDKHGSVYFGGGAVVARAQQSLWLLFSQQTALVLYPRLFAGYVFK